MGLEARCHVEKLTDWGGWCLRPNEESVDGR